MKRVVGLSLLAVWLLVNRGATMPSPEPGAMRQAAAREENGSYPIIRRESPRQRWSLSDVPSSLNGSETAGSGTSLVPPLTSGLPDTSTVERGTASHVGTRFGRRYLALPEHRWGRPGIRVTICGDGGCVTRTSTDAGPDKAMQRAGRVADLNWWDFMEVCGVGPDEPDPGLCTVTIAYGATAPATLPPTDTP